MSESQQTAFPPSAVTAATSRIVCGFLRKSALPADQVGTLIVAVGGAVRDCAKIGQTPAADAFDENRKPAVPIAHSIRPDFLVCLEDGAKLKMLRSHLRKLNLTPEQYRARWGLPPDYPMVCPNYSKVRSRLASSYGLGRNGRRPRPASQSAAAA